MNNENEQKCKVRVRPTGRYGSFNMHYCGKPVEGISSDGKTPMCGGHLAGERRREKNANKGRSERKKEIEFAKEVTEFLESRGIRGHATGYRHRQCIVNFDELKKAISALK